jgi:hypothetical protein
MISTIETDLVFENGVAKIVWKEYPNWYGIEDVGFIWHGSWSDPEIEYKGKRINSTIVEDTMWERFREDCEEDGEIPTEDKFELYMMVNQEDVYELIELAMEV